MNERNDIVARFLMCRSAVNREAVIAAHLYLCQRGARKFQREESERADLEQVAAVGLIKATDTYRAERTTPFEAYAWLIIVGELMHYVRDHELIVRPPRWLRSLERRYAEAWERFAARFHVEPTANDLAAELDVDVTVIQQLRAMRRNHRVHDLDPDSSRSALHCDALPAPANALSLEDRLTVAIALEALTERERTVVVSTFCGGLSQAEIALSLGLSQSQISKILGRALGKLQHRVA